MHILKSNNFIGERNTKDSSDYEIVIDGDPRDTDTEVIASWNMLTLKGVGVETILSDGQTPCLP